MSAPRLPLFALRSYPSWWREQREDEVVALLEDGAVVSWREPLVALDLARHGLAVRLRGTGMPSRPELWRCRTQGLVLLATVPWMLILPFSGALAIGVSGRVVGREPLPPMPFDARVASDSAGVGALVLVAVFMVLAWGWGALRADASMQRRGWARVRATTMCLSPLIAAVTVVGVHQLGVWVSPSVMSTVTYYVHGVPRHRTFYAPGRHPLLGDVFAVVTPLVGCLALLVTAYCVVRVATTTRWDAESLRRGVRSSWTVSLLGLSVAVLTAVHGIAIQGMPTLPTTVSGWAVEGRGASWWLIAASAQFALAFVSYRTSRESRRARATWVRLAGFGGVREAA